MTPPRQQSIGSRRPDAADKARVIAEAAACAPRNRLANWWRALTGDRRRFHDTTFPATTVIPQ